VKIGIIQTQLEIQSEELRVMGEWVLSRDGTPSWRQETDVVPAHEHHRVSTRDEKPGNRTYFHNWDGNYTRDVCLKVCKA
jgi:hypothetical protein